jgi:cyclopropane-fatty-acyl-phospholipid synthase
MNQKQMAISPTYQQGSLPNGEKSLAWIKKALLSVLEGASTGHLILRENGIRIAEFGQPGDALQAEINVIDSRCYTKALIGGDAAAGEAFVDGWWTTPDITMVTRFFSRNLDMMDAWGARFGWLLKPISWYRLLKRSNTKRQAKRNILAHYDLGNDLYATFLDTHKQYSSGLFLSGSDTLEQAQVNKMQRLCDQLNLSSADHLVEIGTGWGGLAIFAAKNYGCKVTTTTISKEQYDYAQKAINAEDLCDKIELLNQDYRELDGQYDKLVSVEMIEAVGRKFLPGYFAKLNHLVKPGGLVMLQAITIADQRFDEYSKCEDFIQKHIFPGGFLPSLSYMNKMLTDNTNLIVRDVHDMGIDYARTLNQWRRNFLVNTELLESMGYSDQFRRLWEYYLGYCEGGFLERRISTVQLLASKSPHY